jgi:hypothetical protein
MTGELVLALVAFYLTGLILVGAFFPELQISSVCIKNEPRRAYCGR